jgi:hypothetical protein
MVAFSDAALRLRLGIKVRGGFAEDDLKGVMYLEL